MASTSLTEIHPVENEMLPLMTRIKTMLLTVVPPECCIFRVPKALRKIKESAYTPSAISIGPFHRNSDELQIMQAHKVRYLNHVLDVYRVKLYDLIKIVKDSEKRVRQCYEEYIDLCSDDFSMMVLLDGVFVVEYFRRHYIEELKDDNDKVLSKLKLRHSIWNDLILIENQLPFFVIESLYNLVLPNARLCNNHVPPEDDHTGTIPSFLTISCHFFTYLNRQKIEPPAPSVLHFTDLIRKLHLLAEMKPPICCENNGGARYSWSSYSAKELEESGITFKADPSKCLFDTRFTVQDGIFLIPRLAIYDSTESIFRNMMTLEQYLYDNEMYICDYAILMDTLIDTCKDVELLVREGIVKNRLGDQEEVAALFNNLNREIMFTPDDRYYFNKLDQDLDIYYRKPWHKRMASLRREYLSSLWKVASVIAAVILLVLTIIQTICSIIQVAVPLVPKVESQP